MESFNKKIQDKFEEHSNDIPSEFSWDNLGEGILEGVDKKKNSKKRYFLLFLLAFGIIGITATTFYFVGRNTNKPIVAQELNTENENNFVKNIENTLENKINKPIITELKPEKSINSSAASKSIKENNTYSKTQEEIIPTNSLTIKRMITRDDGNDRLKNENSVFSPVKVKQQEVEELMPNSNEKIIAPSTSFAVNENSISPTNFGLEPKKETGLLAIYPFDFNYQTNMPLPELNLPSSIIVLAVEDETTQPIKKVKHSIGITTGLIGWNYTSEVFDLESYETTLASWNAGLNYGYHINNRWSISTGLTYGSYRSRLRNVFTTVTQHYNEDAVQNVINRVTGESHQVVGANETVTTQTLIVHHNTLNTLSVPVSLSYLHPVSDRLSIGLTGGVQWNTLLSRNGRGINTALQLLEYSDLPALQSNFFSGTLAINGSYRLMKQTHIEMRLGGNQALNSFEFSSGDNRSISGINLNVGVRRYF
jgi:hypothetical protein